MSSAYMENSKYEKDLNKLRKQIPNGRDMDVPLESLVKTYTRTTKRNVSRAAGEDVTAEYDQAIANLFKMRKSTQKRNRS